MSKEECALKEAEFWMKMAKKNIYEGANEAAEWAI
jgi:hypothetical protein